MSDKSYVQPPFLGIWGCRMLFTAPTSWNRVATSVKVIRAGRPGTGDARFRLRYEIG